MIPLTVQTDTVVEAKLTGSPDVALADSGADIGAGVALTSVWSPGEVNEMFCADKLGPEAAFTTKLTVTGVAAAKDVLPAWLAVKVQVPTDNSVSAAPLTEQTFGVVEVIDTLRPEVELAVKLTDGVARVRSPGDANPMLWIGSVGPDPDAPNAR